ncbi:MAG: thioredoxin domain-containing protein [Cucumibacter sp.]
MRFSSPSPLLAAVVASLLVLAACEQKPETPSGEAPATPATNETPEIGGGATSALALHDGSPLAIVSPEALLNPKGLVDRPLGGVGARVWLIEYASPTCPACADFHVNTYPALKAQYIDTGKIVFLLRPFIRNTLDAVVFMLAECSVDKYHDLMAGFFERQTEWATSATPRDAILTVALDYGFTEETFDVCLENQDLFAKLDDERTQALDEFGLEATPTFYMQGKQFSGSKPIEDMQAEIDPLL